LRAVRRKAGRPTLKSAPITERMTIAKMEMTMLLNYLALWNESKSTKEEYHVHAFSADTRGFIVVILMGSWELSTEASKSG
jgi:hypothetical protein